MHFRPRNKQATAALSLLVVFVALQALLLASTFPPLWGPDEDYHWNYISHISEKGSVANPHRPFYTKEFNAAMEEMDFHQFGMYPAKADALVGDPHAVTKKLDRLPAEMRRPEGGPARPVVHAPLYHGIAALVTKPFEGRSIFTKIWLARAVNALSGMLAVYAAWLLAAQIFSREGPRLFVAGLTAVQPMFAFSTGTMTNDTLTIAWFTMTIAVLCSMLTNKPGRAQGRLVGVFAGLALLSKSSALILGPMVLVAFAVQWRRHPLALDRAELRRSLGWATGMSLAIAGWFYAFLIIKYHTLLGNVGELVSSPQGPSASLLSLPHQAVEWLWRTYQTYWSHYVYFESARLSTVTYVPLLLGSAAIAGFFAWMWRVLRDRSLSTDLFRTAIFLTFVVVFTMLPFLGMDMVRIHNGNGFMMNGGRFILPAYPAACVLFVIGVRELLRPRTQRWAYPLLSLVAAWQGLWMWKVKTIDRYFGGDGITGFKQELQRASFFRPEWVTTESLLVLIALMLTTGAAAWVFGVRAHIRDRRPGGSSPDPAVSG